jgi:hypothetical protein
MRDPATRAPRFLRAHWPLVALPAAKLAIQLAAIPGYGYFRDEFYYVACARRLAFGYVDHPPLSVVLLRGVIELFGTSLWALRIVPALAGAATVLLVGLIARELGGRRFAQLLAMSATLAAPEYLGMNHVYTMNSLDLLFWTLAAWLMVRLIKHPSPRLWLALGLLLGLGLQNKISVLWLGGGLLVGMVLTEHRRQLRTQGPWLAAAVAVAVFLPHLVWQTRMGWPTVEFIRSASANKMLSRSVADFVRAQIDMMNPIGAFVWLAGLAWLLAAPAARRVRLLAWTYLFVFAVLAVNSTSRAGYLASGYTWLFAAGGVVWEALLDRPGRAWARVAALVLVLSSGAAIAPFGLPVLSVPRYIAYAEALGKAPSTEEKKDVGALPQWYADMHGWDAIVDSVRAAYEQVPPTERARSIVFAPDYGVAGAVELLGRSRGLPRVASGHNNFWLWGPPAEPVETVIVVGGRRENLESRFERVTLAVTIDCGYCMPYENHRPIWLCSRPRQPLAALWPALKHYD